MNKRQYKKYKNKWFHKSYYDMRHEQLIKMINMINGLNENLIDVLDSKRGDLKHIIGYRVFTGVGLYPSCDKDNTLPDPSTFTYTLNTDIKAIDLYEKCYRESMRINAKYGKEDNDAVDTVPISDILTKFKDEYICTGFSGGDNGKETKTLQKNNNT